MNILGQKNRKLTVAILGPGAIGGFVAVASIQAGAEVTLVAPRDMVEVLKEMGLSYRTTLLGEGSIFPTVTDELTVAPDVLFITTKAEALTLALTQVQKVSQNTVVIPLLNGIEHIAVIRKELDQRVVVGMIGGIVAYRNDAGVIISESTSVHIDLASSEVSEERFADVASLLRKSGIVVNIRTSEAEVIWSKLARLCVLAALTGASGMTLGELRSDPLWRQRLITCAQESSAVARSQGFAIEATDLAEQIDALPSTLSTSLSRDVDNGKIGEADAIIGAVIRSGKSHGLSLPCFEELFTLIKRGVI